MFNEYENVVNATIALLKQLKIKVNKSTVAETLQNHSDYPSLLSISDALIKWDIPNMGAKMESKDIEEIPVPFIAYTNYREYPYVVVNEVNDNGVTVFANSYNKTISLEINDFVKNWNGVYLLAEAGEFSGEKNYQRNKFNYFLTKLIPSLAIALLATLSFLFIHHNSGFTPGPSVYVQYSILLAGVAVTIMLLWYEIDKNNPLLHKVCTGIIKGNCNTILTGKASKVVSWLSWSEVGFFYFAGSFLCIVSDPINPLPYILNLLTLPYIVFSIYYQGVVAKQWCLLCLSIQALLLLGGINTIANHSWKFVSDLNLQNTSIALLLYLLPVLLWYSLKAVVLKLQKAKHTKRQYLRLKFAADIFNTLLQKQKTVNISSVARLGIDIGPPHAEHTIIKVCNPYCGPCSKAHPEIERLMEENPNVKVKIIFTANTDEKDFRNKPVKHLLAIADRNNEQVTKQALDDWYLADKKDYAIFSEKYPMNGEIAQQENKIVAMEKWCEETGIKFTPTIFISQPSSIADGKEQQFYQLPDEYSINDINYFFLEAQGS